MFSVTVNICSLTFFNDFSLQHTFLLNQLTTGLDCDGWFSSVSQSCLTLCDPMNRSTPALPVHHQLPEFTQTHVHRVSDAIQPSHPLLSPSPPAPIPPSMRVFSNQSTLCMRWPKYLIFSFGIILSKEHSGLISFEMDWLDTTLKKILRRKWQILRQILKILRQKAKKN